MTTQINQLTELTSTSDGDLLLIRENATGVDKKMQASNLRAKATTKGDVGLGDVDNVSAASLRDRSTHTGTQPLSTISDSGTMASQNANSVNIDGGTIDGTAVNATNLAYTGTLTGGTGVVNIGSGQVYKDASGNVGIGTTSPAQNLHINPTSTGVFSEGLRVNRQGVSNQYTVLNYSGGIGRIVAVDAQNSIPAIGFYTSTNGTTETERMRIDSSGNVLIGTTTGTNSVFQKSVTENGGEGVFTVASQTGFNIIVLGTTGTGYSAANTTILVKKDTGTNRSINAAGTVNASGADYAEYMTKAGDFELAKGDICGVNLDGKLTNVFAGAVAFVVKSTNPSYVGGDTWGSNQTIGDKPEKPLQQAAEVDEEGNETQAAETDEDFAARQAQYEIDLAEFEAKLEAERQKVDRIAFSGQVPVNVTGATAGQYIVPVENNGGITGVAVNKADMTLAQYMKAVGKVIAIEDDGRARIIVKVA